MKKPDKLKLLAVGTKMINDHDALDGGVCRYIGRRWDATLHGFPPSDKPSEVRPLPEYVYAVQHGDLAPADQATADYCGVQFIKPQQADLAELAGTEPFNGKF